MKAKIANLPAWLAIYTLGNDLLSRIETSREGVQLAIGSIDRIGGHSFGIQSVYTSRPFVDKDTCVQHCNELLSEIVRAGRDFMNSSDSPMNIMIGDDEPKLTESNVLAIVEGLRSQMANVMIKSDGAIQPSNYMD